MTKKSDLFAVGAQVSWHMAALLQGKEGRGSAVYSRPRGNPLSAHSYFIVSCIVSVKQLLHVPAPLWVTHGLPSLTSVPDPAFSVERPSPRVCLQSPVAATFFVIYI